MGNPVLTTGYGAFYYLCDRDPTSTELDVLDPANSGIGVYVNIPDFKYAWFNTTSNEIFWCTDNTFNAMIWNKITTDNNISAMLNSLGFSAPTSQSYTNVSSPAFSSSRTPHNTKNTFVIANISQTSVLLGNATVNAIVDSVQVASSSIGGVAATQNNSLSFMVAPTDSYELTQSVSGLGSSNSIISIKEFYL